ncbi:MAG: PIN domain-containing protein [Phycisphaerae bacterium]|nr:PIN domain-containing protein [Phycisphaerae bacterium]
MTKRIALDTGPLGMIAHPKANRATAEWFRSMLESDCEVIVPEIADYEVRRNLILEKLTENVKRLDQLKRLPTYLPIDTAAMVKAANLWAEARRRHKPTANKHALDGDAILAAQARLAGAVVATDNVGHLDQFVKTRKWCDMGFRKNRAS